VSPRGDRIVFTSVRSGDLDIYTMNLDGSGIRRITHEPGYDGGAFFSPDGSEIVYRAWHPTDEEDLTDYRSLLERSLIRPNVLNLYVINADGTDRRLVLENGAANFAPYFFPDGERIIFSSNLTDGGGRNFDLYMIGKDGTGLERVTTHESFDGFPMFSPDGRYLAFASNRNNRAPHDTNIFIAEWIE
jgi:Tol biopolymer transport system component